MLLCKEIQEKFVHLSLGYFQIEFGIGIGWCPKKVRKNTLMMCEVVEYERLLYHLYAHTIINIQMNQNNPFRENR